MPNCLLCVVRHETLQLGFRLLVIEIGLSRAPKDGGKFRPGVGRVHVDDPHRLDAGARWLDREEARALASVHAPPEFLFGGQAATGNDREDGFPGIDDPNVCWTWAICFSAAASSQNDQGSMNFASKTAPFPSTSGLPLLQVIVNWDSRFVRASDSAHLALSRR